MRSLTPPFALFCLLAAAAPGWTATLQVTTTTDSLANDGACSLREAISAANGNVASGAAAGECGAGLPPPYDVIELPAGSHRLERTGAVDDSNLNGDLDLRRGGIQIVGAGADVSEVRGDRIERVFDIGSGLPSPSGGAARIRTLVSTGLTETASTLTRRSRGPGAGAGSSTSTSDWSSETGSDLR